MAVKEPWPALRNELEKRVAQDGRSERAIAKEIGISPGTLRNLIDGTVDEPYGRTREAVEEWIDGFRAPARSINLREVSSNLRAGEMELLQAMLDNFETMATFMTAKTQNLRPADRRMVMFAIVSSVKQLALELGKPIPPELFDLERRLLADEQQ